MPRESLQSSDPTRDALITVDVRLTVLARRLLANVLTGIMWKLILD
jgi:hypothetical protein